MPSVIARPPRSFIGATMIGAPAGDATAILLGSTSALPAPSGLSSVRCTASTFSGSPRMPGLRSSTNENAAHLAQIILRGAPRDRLPLLLPQPSGLRALTLFVSFVVDALRLWCLRQCRAGLLASQSFDRLAKGDAVEMLDKVDHIAAFGAAATIPDLLANMDGETI